MLIFLWWRSRFCDKWLKKKNNNERLTFFFSNTYKRFYLISQRNCSFIEKILLSASSSSLRQRCQLEKLRKWTSCAEMVKIVQSFEFNGFLWKTGDGEIFFKIWKKSSLNIIQKILILTVEISTIFSLTRHSDNRTKVKILKSWFYVLRKNARRATVVLKFLKVLSEKWNFYTWTFLLI